MAFKTYARSYAAHLAAFDPTVKTVGTQLPVYTSPWFPPGSSIISPWNPGVEVVVSMTPNAYWASKHPLVQKLYGVTDVNVWMELAKKHRGIWIDDEIMVQNMDPPTVQALRIQYGYTWVPNA